MKMPWFALSIPEHQNISCGLPLGEIRYDVQGFVNKNVDGGQGIMKKTGNKPD
jgi:hypothetical protein